jgi:HEAT repeat protein
MRLALIVPLALIVALTWGQLAPAADRETVSSDEALLKSVKLGTDSAALLAFFRSRTPNEANQAQVKVQIALLGEPSAQARIKARARLLELGRVALPLLQEAAKGSEPKVKNEAARLARLLSKSDSAVPAAAARLLALLKPAGAVAVLLEYVPFADDDLVAGEVRTTLTTLAGRQGSPDAALLAGLGDRDHVRRAVAAEALAEARLAGSMAAVRKLLQDPEPAVCLRVALALTSVNEATAVPVLVSLLESLPKERAQQAHEALVHLAGVSAPPEPLTEHAAGRKNCRAAWEAWWRRHDSPALLAYFKQRTLTDAGRDAILELIRRLGHRSYRVREQAAARLVLLKRLAVPFLKEALNDSDAEIRARADACLKRIEAIPEAAQSAAHIRLLALRKPPGTTAVLLAFLRFADDESVLEELYEALASLAVSDGKANPDLLAALEDRLPLCRAAAAEALCRGRAVDGLPAVSKLLQDQAPEVRLRTAVALANRGDKPAILALIDFLGEVPQGRAWLAEETLRRLAGSTAPSLSLGDGPDDRRWRSAAWRAWWQENRDKLDVGALGGRPPVLGYTLVAQWDLRGRVNDLIELGTDRKPRWRIPGLQYSFDFQVLPGNRLLVAEHLAHRVTERDFQGKVLWEYKTASPVNCQRLANGNTFVVCAGFVVEVRRDKTEVLKINVNGIMAGGKAANGQAVVLTSAGKCIRYNGRGQELKSFSIGGPMNNCGGMEVLPHGHVLVASYHSNKVVEYDSDGKAVWTHAIPEPGFASRLGSGNTLITSQGSKYAVEVTRAGKVVWEYRPGQAIWQARRR